MEQAILTYEQNKFMKMASYIIKYQKFSTAKILEKFKAGGIDLSEKTAINYINLGISYIRSGKKYKVVPTTLYKFLDQFMAEHLQPLTPSFEDRRREGRPIDYTKKNVKLPIQNIEEVKTQKLTEKFEYGVKLENRIILFNKESEMRSFIKNVGYINTEIELLPVIVKCERMTDGNS